MAFKLTKLIKKTINELLLILLAACTACAVVVQEWRDSSCVGKGQEASVVLKKLADALATKRNENYSHVIGCLRCCLAILLARSAI